MSGLLKPIFLLADSQLLFWQANDIRFLASARKLLRSREPAAAYIGAANDDRPEFYEIFTAAMDAIGIRTCEMIRAGFSAGEAEFVDGADILLLAGGSVERGWQAFRRSGLAAAIRRRYGEGALLIGVSAGAVHLGLCGWPEGDAAPDRLFDTFGLAPYAVGVHDEREGWQTLRRVVRSRGVQGIGIPTGAGLIYHPDRSLEPVRFPAHLFSAEGERLLQPRWSPGA